MSSSSERREKGATVDKTGGIKVNTPDLYYSDRRKLKAYFVQVEMYCLMHLKKFPDMKTRIIFAATYLRGVAQNWYLPYFKDYVENIGAAEQMKQKIRDLFASYPMYKAELQKIFGSVDEEKEAEQRMLALRQTGAVIEYASKFQQVAARLEWNKEALRAQFYQGLKESIKDRLMFEEDIDDLEELIKKAIKADQQIYQRNLERQGKATPVHKKKGYSGRKEQQTSQPWDPIDLDATQETKGKARTGRKRFPMSKKKREQYEKKLCFRCGKPGYQAKACYGSQQLSATHGSL